MTQPTDETAPLHVVLGAGQIGRKLAQRLLARGLRVRLVRRGPAGPSRPGLEWRSGDLTDPAFADAVCAGAARIYNCVNPPDYGKWAGVVEPLHGAVQDAAVRAQTPLVHLDCLYMVGLPEAVPFDEDAPMNPRSTKGEMRARLVRRALKLRDAGDLRITFGRAPDYFGPDSPDTGFGERFLERLARGAAAEVLGDPDLPRSYAYTPDVAEGLAILGTRAEAFDRAVWHLPVSEVPTTRALVEAFYRMAGREPKLKRLPSWLLRAFGLVSPLMRGIAEMTYQWEHPFVVNDARFREAFGARPTPLAEAVDATLAAAGVPTAEPLVAPA